MKKFIILLFISELLEKLENCNSSIFEYILSKLFLWLFINIWILKLQLFKKFLYASSIASFSNLLFKSKLIGSTSYILIYLSFVINTFSSIEEILKIFCVLIWFTSLNLIYSILS